MAGQRGGVDPEDVLDLQAAQIRRGPPSASASVPGWAAMKAALIAPAETPVMIGEAQVGEAAGEAAQHAGLIGAPRAAAREDQGEASSGLQALAGSPAAMA